MPGNYHQPVRLITHFYRHADHIRLVNHLAYMLSCLLTIIFVDYCRHPHRHRHRIFEWTSHNEVLKQFDISLHGVD